MCSKAGVITLRLALVVAMLAAGSPSALAQGQSEVPKEIANAVITEHPNAQVPLDAYFLDENGNPVTLDKYFHTGKPVILNLAYLRCPMLCTVVINGMVDALRKIKYSAGDDFTILTISFDPMETYGLASIKRRGYLDLYGRPGADSGWHFLTGTEKQIKAVTDAVGFGFAWNAELQNYAHGSGLFVLTPDGRVSRTLYGVEFNPTTLKGSLLEAGQGRVGTPLDKVYFACLHFDPSQGKYTTSVVNLTRFVASMTILALGLSLLGYFRLEAAQKRRALAAAGPQLEQVDPEVEQA